MGIIQELRKQKALHAVLVMLGIRSGYRFFRALFLRLVYGSVKKIQIGGQTYLFSIKSDAARNFYNNRYWFGELFEKEVTLHIMERLKSAKCFLDVGACLGFYSIIAAKLSAPWGGSVHAIEMDADNIRNFQESVRLNHLSNVSIYQLAAGEKNGAVSYYQCGTEVHTLDPGLEQKGKYAKVEVPMVMLDSFTAEKKIHPDVIKIDVEGAEWHVLQGMTSLLKRPNLKLYIELHLHHGRGSLESFGHQASEVLTLLRANGFQLEMLPLRQDSKLSAGPLTDETKLTESVMLYCSKK